MPHSAEDIALACLPWAAFYGIVFGASRVLGPALFAHCRNLDAPGRSYWAESVVSTVNSLVLTPMAWRASEETDLLNLATSFSAATPLTTLCCVAMCGYTAWDTLLVVRYRREWSGFGMYAVHHAGSILAWGLCAVTGYAHVIAVPALLMEATGPFVNLRYFLSTAGLKEGKLYLVNGVLMFFSFLVTRVIFNWWLYLSRFWWQRELMWQLPPAIVLSFNLLFPVNLLLQMMWFAKITKGVLAVLARCHADGLRERELLVTRQELEYEAVARKGADYEERV